MTKHPDDGKHVVVQNGQRVSGTLHETRATADKEAEALRKNQPVVETGQGKAPEPPKVAQNLYG